ncbi:MAG: enoyl-CoA hydratase/isomerase family protein [bacterium]
MINRDVQGNIVVLQMTYGKVNAMDIEFCEALFNSFQEEEKSAAKAVVLTGNGAIFSAGVDLFRVLSEDKHYTLRFLGVFADLLKKLFTFSKPIIAAINGHAIAGGCVLACACDYRIMAADSGKIGIPELLVGVPFPSLAMHILQTAIPQQHLHKLIYSGTTLAPDDAIRKGLIDETAPADKLIEEANGIAKKYGTLSASAFGATKRLLRDADFIAENKELLDQETLDIWTSNETRERIRIYLENTLGKKK